MKSSLNFETRGWVKNGSLYITRKIDGKLLEHIRNNERLICIAEPHQSGKTTLVHKTCDKLQFDDGICPVFVDLSLIMSSKAAEIDSYFSIARRINSELKLSNDEIKMLWQKHKENPKSFCLEFFHSLSKLNKKIVIFVDELGMVRTSESGFDNFFSSIGEFKNISFVLSGVFSTHYIGKNSPYFTNLKKTFLPLDNFTREEMNQFSEIFNQVCDVNGEKIVDGIYEWTGGQPYMSQKISETIVDSFSYESTPMTDVDKIVEKLFLEKYIYSDVNLASASKNFSIYIEEPDRREIALTIYENLLKNGYSLVTDNLVKDFQVEPEIVESVIEDMRICGLIVRDENSNVKFRNKIYRTVFDDKWVESQRKSGEDSSTAEVKTSNE